MTPAEKQQLDAMIDDLAKIQAAAPVKTTYAMGRADHSISHQLLDILRRLKAFRDESTSTSDTEPVRTEAGTEPVGEPVRTVNPTGKVIRK